MEFFRTWFSGREISVLGRTWCGFPGPKTWEILGYGFQDVGSQLWVLDFHTRGFQDRNLRNFRTWFSGRGTLILEPGFQTGGFAWSRTWNFLAHGFQDVESHIWDLDFTLIVSKTQTWKILGHDFQDMGSHFLGPEVFKNWGVPWPRTWKCLGHGFQDVESCLWDLDFTSGVSEIQTWKLLGHDLQDVGPQLWDLDFRTGGGFHDPGPGIFLGYGFQDVESHLWDLDFTFGVSKDPNLETLRTWFSGRGTSVLGSGFSHWGWFLPWPWTWKFLGHGFSRCEIKSSVFGDLEFAPTDDQWRRIEKRMLQGR